MAWNLFVELRKELVESQRIRAQIIGFKITFISAAVGLIATKLDALSMLLFIPAFASVFFDLLIISYSYSIKRTGHYCRHHLEPVLKESYDMPKGFAMWEEFMSLPASRQNLSFWGNLGITLLVSCSAVAALIAHFRVLYLVLAFLLLAFVVLDVCAFYQPRKFHAQPQTPVQR